MNILIVGGGGREHAIAWKVLQSPRAEKVFVAPGNGGTASSAKLENVPIKAIDIPALLEFAILKEIDLTIIGPDDPLAAGIVDAFEAKGLRVFGASQAASKLEWSKGFAKTMMRQCSVPTADFAVCQNLEDGLEVVRDNPFSTEGFVIKADGLALGKGVLICDSLLEAEDALEQMFSGAFGEAGQTVIIEQRLSGREVSALCFCDGLTARMMPPARDHKRALNGDNGLNTGGMGAYAPAPDISAALLEEIRVRVVQPILEEMAARGEPFKGVLYPGIMLTENGISVLEFNARFGDPETQVLLPLLETDLLEIIDACIKGTLHNLEPVWKKESCATVVMASGGYPLTYETGFEILGLEAVPKGVMVFHAGTKLEQGKVVSSGGRVLSVSATGKNLEEALHKAYSGVKQISFSQAHYRTDIGEIIVLPKSANAYAKAGVNIAEGTRAVALMQDAVRSTHDARVVAGVGAFGGVFDVSSLKSMERPLLVASTDGVGTKTMVAAQVGNWSGIGADIVNHGINDILVQGAKPLFFLDYIAANNLKAEWVATIVS
ncbi:MAG: phosphoribosylamine-glycine ligase, partial [Deinococcota bacterium]